jgi:hypothetical protein
VTTLKWAILHTIIHEDVLARVEKEIDEVSSPNQAITTNDRTNMPYIQAVLNVRSFYYSQILKWTRVA